MGDDDPRFGEGVNVFTTEEGMPQAERPREWRILAALGGMSLFELGLGIHSLTENHIGAGVGALVAATIVGGVAALEGAGILPHTSNTNIRGRY